MAFTSPELVRTHLGDARLGESTVRDVAIVLNGAESTQLPHAGLVSGSVVVKSRRSESPQQEDRVLADAWVALSYSHLIRDSVLVALDTSLSVSFVENVDYIIDYDGGRIRRTPGGSIPSGQSVIIWYDPYHIYLAGDDYAIATASGTITRIPSGTIGDGQEVLVDYTVSLGSVSDDVIDRAISEAEESVLAEADPIYHQNPVHGIVVAETHLAVGIVSRMRAAAALADSSVTSATARVAAQTWLELATRYERSGRERLMRFAAPVASKRTGRIA